MIEIFKTIFHNRLLTPESTPEFQHIPALKGRSTVDHLDDPATRTSKTILEPDRELQSTTENREETLLL